MMLSELCCVCAVHVSVWLPGGCVDTGYVSALAAGLRNLLSACRSASKSSIRRFVITEKAPTRAFSWLKAATTAFTFKTLC